MIKMRSLDVTNVLAYLEHETSKGIYVTAGCRDNVYRFFRCCKKFGRNPPHSAAESRCKVGCGYKLYDYDRETKVGQMGDPIRGDEDIGL